MLLSKVERSRFGSKCSHANVYARFWSKSFKFITQSLYACQLSLWTSRSKGETILKSHEVFIWEGAIHFLDFKLKLVSIALFFLIGLIAQEHVCTNWKRMLPSGHVLCRGAPMFHMCRASVLRLPQPDPSVYPCLRKNCPSQLINLNSSYPYGRETLQAPLGH